MIWRTATMLNKPISHDKNGRKIYPDSIVYDEVADEYFFSYCRKDIWGDDFLDDFYPLNPSKLRLIKLHASIDDLKSLAASDTSDSVYNIGDDINGK